MRPLIANDELYVIVPHVTGLNNLCHSRKVLAASENSGQLRGHPIPWERATLCISVEGFFKWDDLEEIQMKIASYNRKIFVYICHLSNKWPLHVYVFLQFTTSVQFI